MRRVALAAYLAATSLAVSASAPAIAAYCPGNPNALGTSRVITVDPAQFGKLGTIQYSHFPQLPLADHEVVLTFDDGPIPPYSDSVLRTLAAECVKATYFMIGRQANEFPEAARRVRDAGHTIGTHSQNHPLTFDRMPLSRAQREIEDGIASVGAALGDPRAVAPFFRIPGLLRVGQVEDYLASRGIAVWSADADADDWYRTATPDTVVRKALNRLERHRRGILLLHDIQPATAMALPRLLRELKQRGYRVVHVVPQGEMRPRPPMLVAQGQVSRNERQGWPRIAMTRNRDVGFSWGPPQVERQRVERRRVERHVRRPIRVARRHVVRKTRTAARGWTSEPR